MNPRESDKILTQHTCLSQRLLLKSNCHGSRPAKGECFSPDLLQSKVKVESLSTWVQTRIATVSDLNQEDKQLHYHGAGGYGDHELPRASAEPIPFLSRGEAVSHLLLHASRSDGCPHTQPQDPLPSFPRHTLPASTITSTCNFSVCDGGRDCSPREGRSRTLGLRSGIWKRAGAKRTIPRATLAEHLRLRGPGERSYRAQRWSSGFG